MFRGAVHDRRRVHPGAVGPRTAELRIAADGESTTVALDGTGNLYVTNLVVNSILVFPAGATDNVPPLRTISGTNTGLSSPTGVVLDNAGNLYVTNNNVNSITVYPPGASGNVPPSRTISGGLVEPSFIYLR